MATKQMPRLSVITINYNNLTGLMLTVQSVLAQSFKDFEYVVIDGGSTDGSAAYIQEHASQLAYFVSESDSGIYNAQNKGIKAAKGEYLLFLNSGDFLCNSEVLQTVFSYPVETDIVFGNMMINWGEGQVSRGLMPDTINLEHMYRDTLWHPVSFIRKAVFDRLGLYDESYRLVADYEFFFKAIVVHKVSARRIDVDIAEYDTRGASSDPANKKQELEERNRVWKTYLKPEEIAALEKRTAANKNIFTKLRDLIRR